MSPVFQNYRRVSCRMSQKSGHAAGLMIERIVDAPLFKTRFRVSAQETVLM
jgi:hypothetical protein